MNEYTFCPFKTALAEVELVVIVVVVSTSTS